MMRTYVYDLLKVDGQLNALGINGTSLYPANAPDAPMVGNQMTWMVLRWGSQTPRFGRDSPNTRRQPLTVWMYNHEPDYAPIIAGLKRVCGILLPLGGISHGTGYITDVEDNGSSEDLYDRDYEAVTRNWTFTITGSES